MDNPYRVAKNKRLRVRVQKNEADEAKRQIKLCCSKKKDSFVTFLLCFAFCYAVNHLYVNDYKIIN